MNDKLKDLKVSMTSTVLSDVKFDENLEIKILQKTIKMDKKTSFSFKYKAMYLFSAVMATLILFFVSAIYSPSIAKIAAKVPYIGVIFDSRPIFEIIESELIDRGYKDIESQGRNVANNTVQFSIGGSSQYFNEVKSDVKRISNNILKLKGYDSYSTRVVHEPNPRRIQKFLSTYKQLGSNAEKVLRKGSFLIIDVDVLPLSEVTDKVEKDVSLVIRIPETESNVKEIENKVRELIIAQRHNPVKIRFDKIRVSPVDYLMKIDEVLTINKEYYKYKGMTISGTSQKKSDIFRLQIKTNLKGTDTNVKLKAKKAEKDVLDILNSKQVEPYLSKKLDDLLVTNKDGKRIN